MFAIHYCKWFDFNCRFLVRVSYLQIYNEDVCDLLGKSPTTKLEVELCVCVYVYACAHVCLCSMCVVCVCACACVRQQYP